MRDKKINYYYNDEKIGRNKFYNELRNRSLSKVRSYDFGGLPSIDVYDFDKKKFAKYKNKLNGYNGYVPVTLIFFQNDIKDGKFKIEKIKK